MATAQRDLFRNHSGGYIGAVVLDPGGKQRGVAVAPDETVWLSEEEQVLTANAPRDAVNNPLTNGTLVLESDASEVRNRRPLRPEQAVPAPAPEPPPPAETGTPAPAPPVEPETGTLAPGEEVGTPDAPQKAAENEAARKEAAERVRRSEEAKKAADRKPAGVGPTVPSTQPAADDPVRPQPAQTPAPVVPGGQPGGGES